MKKLLRNFEFTAPVVASFLVFALTGMTVFAGPGGMPPGGNVDANFNSVSAGTGAPASNGIGGEFKGALYGAKGIATGGGMAAGGEFEGGQFGVEAKATGMAGIGGNFNGKGAGIVANSDNGYGGEFHSVNSGGGLFDGAGYGVLATAKAPGSTGGSFTGESYGLYGENKTPGVGYAGDFKGTAMGVHATASDAAGKGGQFYGKGMGAVGYTDAGGVAGNFFTTNGGGNTLLATDNYALGVLDGGGWMPNNTVMKVDYSGNITASGHLKSAGGVGTFFSTGLFKRNINVGVEDNLIPPAVCPFGTYAVSCHYQVEVPGTKFQVTDFFMGDDTCYYQVRNDAAFMATFVYRARCFNPNG